MHRKAYIFASFTKVYVIAAVVKSEHHQHQLWAVALLLLLLTAAAAGLCTILYADTDCRSPTTVVKALFMS